MNQVKFSADKIIRATRMSLALLIGFAYVAYSGVSDGFWVYITISLVLFDSATIGGTMAKGSSRTLGTLIASIYALVFIIGFANNFVINIIAIIIGIFLSVYLFMDSKYTYGGLLTWTLPVLLINNNDIKSSFLRLFNIMIGALIAYIMHRRFYPVKAHNKLLGVIKNTLSEINKLLEILITSARTAQINAVQVTSSGNTILAEIGKFTKFYEEACLEKFLSIQQLDAAKNAYVYIRHLYRLLNVTLICLKRGSFKHDTLEIEKLSTIVGQINLIISLLDGDLNNVVWPDSLQVTEVSAKYKKHKTIKLQSIDKPLNEDIAGITFNLAKLYQYTTNPITPSESQ
jgi:hypothetical protein